MHLGRAHKVVAFLEEGVKGFVSNEPKATLEDLATLGWETVARILWIRDRLPRSGPLMPPNTLYFGRDEVKCGLCSSQASLIKSNLTCYSCGQVVTADAELTAPGPGTISGLTDRLVWFVAIQCSYLNCQRPILPLNSSVKCNHCLNSTNRVRITPKKELKELIEETFGEEIRSYNVA